MRVLPARGTIPADIGGHKALFRHRKGEGCLEKVRAELAREHVGFCEEEEVDEGALRQGSFVIKAKAHLEEARQVAVTGVRIELRSV
jgi:hypothetical protein